MAPGVETVLAELEQATFQRLAGPLVVDGTAFDFDAAVVGTDVSHDLVVVSGPSARPQRLVQLVTGLSRTLDRLQSRRPVSLVLVGTPMERSAMAELENHARVLVIEGNAPTSEEVQRAIAVLLPLSLTSSIAAAVDPLEELTATLGSGTTDEHRALVDSARHGSVGVREELRRYIDDAVEDEDNEDQ